MLDRAAHAEGHIEIRRDGLAGLPDLVAVADPARIDGRPRSAHSRLGQDRGQLAQEGEALRSLQAPAARDDDLGLGHVQLPSRLAEDLVHAPPHQALREDRRDLHDFAVSGGGRDGKDVGPQGGQRGPAFQGHGQEGLARVNGPGEFQGPVLDRDAGAIRGHGRAQAGGQPRGQVLAQRRSREEDRRRGGRLDHLGQGGGVALGRIGRKLRIFHEVDLGRAVGPQLGGRALRSGQNGGRGRAQLVGPALGFGQRLERALLDLAVPDFDEGQDHGGLLR